jgi:hypothetical protein
MFSGELPPVALSPGEAPHAAASGPEGAQTTSLLIFARLINAELFQKG